ncbi:MAG: helix-hairpin-helix domain-containing protein [Dictyoglomaceae bacterium]|nr:helix-hairpin-helix domain-containing protein [Dictyoglomaceae bacterium]
MMEDNYKKYILFFSIILVLILILGSLFRNNQKEKEERAIFENFIIVHIAGAVANPGVYKLLEGSRVIDGIQAAGGALPSADLDRLNLAEYLEDGNKILVPEKFISPTLSSTIKGNVFSNNKININFASEKELENLPGIGPSLAKKIVEYREQNGPFKSLEDLEKVRGIGKKKIEQIKDLIEW